MKKICVLALYHKVLSSISILFWLCFGRDRLARSGSGRRPFFSFPLL